MIGGGYKRPSASSDFYDERLPVKIEGLGVSKIEHYLKLFGFGTSTQIDLAGEVSGRVPSPDWKKQYFKTYEDQLWYLGDTYNLSIGQGFMLSTPIQLANAFSIIANGGALYKPQVVKSILPADGSTPIVLEPEIIRENFVNAENIAVVREGMCQAVSSPAGSAYSLVGLPVKAAAKTGTAEIYPAQDIYLNWIVVFAPYDNPEIVLLVLADQVEGLHVVAQRVAYNILNWYFSQ